MNDAASLSDQDLTVPERSCVDALLAGRRADLGGQIMRASVIKNLAQETRPDWYLPPVGLAIHNAIIDGPLDLEGCSIGKPLVFLRCKFNAKGSRAGAIRLRDARLRRFALYECTIDGDLKADRMHVESAVFMTDCTLNGLIRLRGASIGEALAMDSTTISRDGDTAILADGLRLGGPWILRSARIKGEVRLAGARIGGNLLWEEVEISNGAVAANADGALCDGAWVMRRARISGAVRLRGMQVKAIDAQNSTIDAGSEGVNARGAEIASDLTLDGCRIVGGVSLGRAHVGGELGARGSIIKASKNDWAVSAGGAAIDRGLALNGAKLAGGLSVAGAVIGNGIAASEIEIDGQGRAIEGDVVRVSGNWIMRGAKIHGSIRFAGAHIDGQVGFTESTIEGTTNLAIRADGAYVGGGWFMGRSSITGLVRLPAARLDNEMRLRGTTIRVSGGPALYANGVRITRELVLDRGFTTTGGVALDHAEIAGVLELSGSRISSALLARNGSPWTSRADEVLDARYDETAISLVDARLDRVVMPETTESRPSGIVDLSRTRVGSYEDFAAAWPPASDAVQERGRDREGRDVDHLVLDGFLYDHLENPSGLSTVGAGNSAAAMRRRWLEGQSGQDLSTHFKPQAWIQMARRLSAQGYHEDARQLAIWRRRYHRRSASTSRSAKLQGWLLDVFALYGFNPWRTVTWMIAFVLLFAGIWHLASTQCGVSSCKDETVFVMAQKGNFGQDDAKASDNYPAFLPIAYSLDVFLPVVNLGFKDHWRPRIDYAPLMTIPLPRFVEPRYGEAVLTMGHVLHAIFILEMLIGLVLSSLAVTAFTGLLRGEDDSK